MGKKVARLYEQFRPENYDLSLNIDREKMTFSGTVTVRGKKAGRPSQRITFHQKELKITGGKITKHSKKGDREIPVSRINNQNSLDEVRLHSDEIIYPGDYTVTMNFYGKITKAMNGIYPCFFKHDGQDKQLIATQFESHHAREAFPCIDEPIAKATFDLSLETTLGEITLGNTPVRAQKVTGSRQITVFETTPKMSSYLLAFVTGDMKYKEAKTKDGVRVRAYVTPDNIELVDHGLKAAVKILEFFSGYFSIPYPLKKLDLVALPDFNVGAMENWGLMTFRETAMLADPDTSSIESKQIVALVVAHEISHQWFGNLVTMKWWDDLWLNESFANLMEYVAVDAIYPEWNIWEQFVSHETASAKRRDSLADVQPIKCNVNHPDEINTIFDPSIVYAKGGTILHMLMHHMGQNDFRKGLTAYFKKHRYGNTEAEDLWEAFSETSGQDIADFMNGWVDRPGYPLIKIDWRPGRKEIQISQQRFLSDPSFKKDESRSWQVPLATTRPLANPVLQKSSASTQLKSAKDELLIFNHDSHSYFLPCYANPGHLQQIVDSIKDGQVDTIDRLLLLDNYTLLQRGGFSSAVDLLELLKGYENENSESVWGAMATVIGEVRRLVEGDGSEDRLDAIVRKLSLETAQKLGWDDKRGDSAQTLRLRSMATSLAAGAKAETVINEGLKRFEDFKKPADLPASTRTIVYYIGVRHGSDKDFRKILDLYHITQNADEREEIASALTSAKEPGRFRMLFDILQTDAIRRQDFFHWYVWLLRNRYTRQSMWQWVVSEWPWINQEFETDKNYSYFARYPGGVFSRRKELADFKSFFEPKKSVIALERDISLAEADIASRVAWRERNETDVKNWLQKHES